MVAWSQNAKVARGNATIKTYQFAYWEKVWLKSWSWAVGWIQMSLKRRPDIEIESWKTSSICKKVLILRCAGNETPFQFGFIFWLTSKCRHSYFYKGHWPPHKIILNMSKRNKESSKCNKINIHFRFSIVPNEFLRKVLNQFERHQNGVHMDYWIEYVWSHFRHFKDHSSHFLPDWK